MERDDAGLWRWRLQDRFGQIVALGPKGYFSRADCLVAIGAAKAALAAPTREIPLEAGGRARALGA